MKHFQFPLLIVLLTCTGCVSVISDQLRSELDPSISFAQLLESPETSIGKKMMLGGVIVRTNNFEEGSEVEVIQKELDYTDYPESGDYSGGRFIFIYKGFLEPEIYAEKRRVTGAGRILGIRQGKVGEKAYSFPVIEVEELKLWEKIDRYYYPYYYPYYGSFGYGYGYGYPYYSTRLHFHHRHHHRHHRH